jgi:hypothetical protein
VEGFGVHVDPDEALLVFGLREEFLESPPYRRQPMRRGTGRGGGRRDRLPRRMTASAGTSQLDFLETSGAGGGVGGNS